LIMATAITMSFSLGGALSAPPKLKLIARLSNAVDREHVGVVAEIPFTNSPVQQVRLYLEGVRRYWAYPLEPESREIRDYGILRVPSE